MTERYTIKSQGDYFGVVDNNIDDRVCVVNGIHTRIEAAWLMELLNRLNDENEQLKQQIEDLEFKLRTIEAYDRSVKEEHSDTVYDFKKKLEKW